MGCRLSWSCINEETRNQHYELIEKTRQLKVATREYIEGNGGYMAKTTKRILELCDEIIISELIALGEYQG